LANTTVYADAYVDNKQDNISVLDIRVEKTVNFGRPPKCGSSSTGSNMLNSYAAETLTVSTGNLYLQPTAILGPRTGRIGVRFICRPPPLAPFGEPALRRRLPSS